LGEATFTWEDPTELAKNFLHLDSSDRKKFFLESNKKPPIGELMNFKGVEIDEEGSVTWIASPQEYHYNPLGNVHGGFAATMLDSCNSITANCALDKGYLTMTAEIKVNYMRGISLDTGDLFAKGTIEKLGRKVIFVSGKLTDSDSKVYATASSTEIVVEIK
tara:strand:- start:1144 stop:1629 length:486 start_codon:yes stop_codon:yes gene_type:complete